jgi:BASS family bile acid:Na+ symporter
LVNPKDMLLLFLSAASFCLGVFAPGLAGIFSGVVVYLMMCILFLSFLKLDFTSLLRIGPAHAAEITVWTLVKLALLPLVMWPLAELLVPEWSLPVVLLASASTGVMVPFLASMVGADVGRPLQVVIITSFLVPFTAPAFIKLLFGQEWEIPFLAMTRMLAMVIFVPILAVLVGRKVAPGLLKALDRRGYPLFCAAFATSNMGIFATYSEFIKAHAGQIGVALIIAAAFIAASLGLGLIFGVLSKGRLDGLSGALSLALPNNGLVVVFAWRFFEPQAPLLAAVHILPFFLTMIPFRYLARQRNRSRINGVTPPA